MDYQLIISLLTLIALEVVLGIDNIIFISILAGKLPPQQQRKARNIGILLAMVMRLGLLAIISVIMKLDNELFNLFNNSFSGKDLILILGGLFLLYKSVKEMYHKMEGEHEDGEKKITTASFASIIGQILLLDLVFSVDSIITAVGLANELWVMYVAVIVTVIIMLNVNWFYAAGGRFWCAYSKRVHLFCYGLLAAGRCDTNESVREKIEACKIE